MVGLEFVRAYIDDVLITSFSTFEDHLEKLELVLQRIQQAGLKVNARKSFFAKGELEYLGYWITREGVQPLADKVKAMLNIAEPKTKKQLRSFIGLINYYRDMWPRRSHHMAPLASLTSKTSKWVWGETQRKAFHDIKKAISRQVLLAYPDFSKEFVIHTDASHLQLGAVISQDGKPIAFYSRKLNDAQTRYTTTERELLSIVETLKEFRNILLGHKIVVHTDHKNLTYKNFSMNSTVHTTNKATPAQLVFGRDAIHNVPFIADWQYLKERKQRIIHQNNKRENATRKPHTYRVGDQVLIRLKPNRKYGEPYAKGPHTVSRVNDNGTVVLQQSTRRGGAVTQTWNIRNLEPY